MAMTHDYLDYLNQKVGISPANSQEELQAAQTIAGLMGQHEVEPQIEEFDVPAVSGLGKAILAIVMFLGVLVSGFGMIALALLGFVLAAIPTALALLRLFGHETSLSLGPTARSQNVIAVHRACGPLVAKGNRPIVIVAHYDSPRENFLYSTPITPYLPLITKASVPCSYAVALCAFVQILGFIPEPARIVLWIVGILASLPSLLLAAGAIHERFSPCTLGANDNKSSVASLLGVMENVRPSGLVPTPRPVVTEVPADEPEASEAESAVDAQETQVMEVPVAQRPARVEVVGVRHGEEVLRELGILPEDCEIEYALDSEATAPVAAPAPEPVPVGAAPVVAATAEAVVEEVDLEPVDEVVSEEEPAAESDLETEFSAGPAAEVETEVEPEADAELEDDTEETGDLKTTAASVDADPEGEEKTASFTIVSSDEPEPAKAETPRDDLLSTGRFSLVMDGEGSRGVGPKDSSGLTAMDDLDATIPAPPVERPKPEAPNDPEWGKSSFRPQLSSVARRATLFDLPDPSARGVDPFEATDPRARRVEVPKTSAPADAAGSAEVPPVITAPEPIETMSSASSEESKSPLSGLIDRIKGFFSKSDDDASDGWLGKDEDDSSDDPVWRGGAATRGGLRLVGEDEGAPTEEELREAALSLGDDALISHDIWFVALGASSLDHAGMRAFLHAHRPEIRGSFVVNLDCVGAGSLSVLSHEGLEATRRADRRLTRLLTGAANDLHATLGQASYDWNSTDALPAMRSSMRSITIMGLDENGMPALSRTEADVAENVSGDQANTVTEIVTEMIRRS